MFAKRRNGVHNGGWNGKLNNGWSGVPNGGWNGTQVVGWHGVISDQWLKYYNFQKNMGPGISKKDRFDNREKFIGNQTGQKISSSYFKIGYLK